MRTNIGMVGMLAMAALSGVAAPGWGQYGPPLSIPRSVALSSRGLAPASFNQIMDAQGFRWDLNQQGIVMDGTNDCFDHACILNVNGQDFNGGQNFMDPKTGQYILSQSVGNVDVTRHIWVDTKQAAVRYVDSFHNKSRSDQTLNVMIRNSLGGSCQMVMNDQGGQFTGALGKKDGGIFAIQHQGNSRPSVFWLLCSPGSKVKPTVSIQNNYEFRFTYSLKARAGQTVSILFVVGQRRMFTAIDAKTMKKMFKPYRDRKFMKGLPSKVARTLANWRGGYYGAAGITKIWTMPDDLQVVPISSDQLVIGEGTRLKGSATLEGLTVEGRFGKVKVPAEDVAALAGPRWPGGGTRVYLRDGQVLAGKMTADTARFTMDSGIALPIRMEQLDRLVMQQKPDDGKPAEGVAVYIETFDRDRFAVETDSEMRLATVTPWGPRSIRVDELMALRPVGPDQPGYEVSLKDQSRFFAFLSGGEFDLKTKLFGRQVLTAADIRGIVSTAFDADKVGEGAATQPHVVLAGGYVLVGRLDLETLGLNSGLDRFPIPPQQIRLLRNVSDEAESDGLLLGQSTVFVAELWGGGTVTGRLDDVVLPIRVGDTVLRVAARDVTDVVVPTPIVPEAARAKIAAFIRDLGHPEWKKREEATTRLSEYGVLAKRSLQEALRQTNDPEVRRRVQGLLDGME